MIAIDRKEYLEWCRECATLPRGTYGTRQMVPEYRKVNVNGMTYYPQGYLLEFDYDGRALHTAILHDLHANSIITCPLEKVIKSAEENHGI